MQSCWPAPAKAIFTSGLRPTGAQPLLWTTGLTASEAYTLKAALDGWTAGESTQEIRGARQQRTQNIRNAAQPLRSGFSPPVGDDSGTGFEVFAEHHGGVFAKFTIFGTECGEEVAINVELAYNFTLCENGDDDF